MNLLLLNFWRLLAEATPWLVGGAAAGAAVQTFVKPAWVCPWLSAGRASVLGAALAGALLPGCSMTTVPLAASLKAQGARLGTLTALVMISPILSPETLVLTASMLGLPMTVGRVALPLVATLAIGWGLNALEARRVGGFRLPGAADACACCGEGPCEGALAEEKKWRRFGRAFWGILHPLWVYLLAGALAVALLKAYAPLGNVDRFLSGGWGAYVAAAVAGIPLYVCEGAEVPLTFALLQMGVGIGPAFTFMLGAVGTCLPTIGMAPRVIGAAATYAYVAAWLMLAIGGGMLMGALAPALRV